MYIIALHIPPPPPPPPPPPSLSQVCELLEEHSEVFSTALAQSIPANSQAKVYIQSVYETSYTKPLYT